MIRSLSLTNFQAHASRTFEFREGLNVIVGPTDAGKSSLIRALTWLALHGNSDYTRHGQKECSVTVETDTGTVTRFKGKRNGYTVNGEDYVAVGATQPVPVSLVLRLSPVNIGLQHDPVYLLSLSPGQIAKEINKIVDLSVIDQCVSWCKKTLAKEDTILQAIQSELSGLTEKRESLSWVPDAQGKWEVISAIRKSVDEIDERISKIEDTVRTIREINITGSNANTVAKALQEFLGKVPEIRDDRELAAVIMQYRESEAKISELTHLVTAFSVFPGLLQQMRDNDIRFMDLTNAMSDIQESGKERDTAIAEIERLEGLLKVCPTCGKNFQENSDGRSQRHGGQCKT